MSLYAPLPAAAPFRASARFDRALIRVSEYIADARSCEERGNARHARAFYALAERYAFATGYTELMRLVWAYQEAPASRAG